MRRLSRIAFALIGLALASEAQAGLLPVTVNVAPEGGLYRWTYALTLPTETMLRAGDYFTIYDFAGYRPDSAISPSLWSFSSATSGPTPAGLRPHDDPALPNLTWTYNGPRIAGEVGNLGPFSALSTYRASADGPFTARTHRTSDGDRDANLTTTTVPVPTAGPQVPEPGTLLLAALGLPFVGLVRRWRKK